MSRVVIQGAGVMGTAISVPFSDNGHCVRLVGTRLDGHIIEDLHENRVHIAAIGGPSIAGELAERRHTCVVLTGDDQTLLDRLAAMLRTSYYHVWTSTDVMGVEVCVALKNVYDLAVGLVGALLEKEGVAAVAPSCTTLLRPSSLRGCLRSATWCATCAGSSAASTLCPARVTSM